MLVPRCSHIKENNYEEFIYTLESTKEKLDKNEQNKVYSNLINYYNSLDNQNAHEIADYISKLEKLACQLS